MKKSAFLLVLVMVFNLLFSVAVFGIEEGKQDRLGEKQINKLRSYGMSEEDLATLSQEKVIEFMRQLSNPPSSEKYVQSQEYTQEEIDKYYEIMKNTGLTSKEMHTWKLGIYN